LLLIQCIFIGLAGTGCSVKTMAVDKLGDALAGDGTVFASDSDSELVRAAAPFSLKLMESLLAGRPRHRGLLLAAASGFTQYTYAFVHQDADELEETDWEASGRLRARARHLYLRARDYGLRGLEVEHPGFEEALRERPGEAVRAARRDDVPLLYWTAVSWAAAISVSKSDPDLVADLPFVEALIDRALELDEAYGNGAVHGFLIGFERARAGAAGDPATRARQHFDRAIELSGGRQAAPHVTLAESVSIGKQDREEFESLLARALDVDVNAKPEWRLANLVMQRRARWLLSRTDRLFNGGPERAEK
jgi:predicted anti-sigma-YlaC factor YlaD